MLRYSFSCGVWRGDNQDGVVTGDGADDVRAVAAIDRGCDNVGGSGRGGQHDQILGMLCPDHPVTADTSKGFQRDCPLGGDFRYFLLKF